VEFPVIPIIEEMLLTIWLFLFHFCLFLGANLDIQKNEERNSNIAVISQRNGKQ
jgi:hypothetical protein